MRFYKYPKWTQRKFPDAIWDFFSDQYKSIYLTFDDGPNPETTPWILNTLDEFDAKATFFCLGMHVQQYPELYKEIIARGHQVGNHCYNHIDGWKFGKETYIDNIIDAEKFIQSKLFRPPYGRIKGRQYKAIKNRGMKTVFWSLMTYDFDQMLDSEKRVRMIEEHTQAGSILVFHDSLKAITQLKNELPGLLKKWSDEGYQFKAIAI